MNGKGPLTPTEQALMRLHNYGCSTKARFNFEEKSFTG